ncbi:MAG: DegT/DnrJ/EryC1/StrS family aminotransferase [Vicinamibacterales bacterium]
MTGASLGGPAGFLPFAVPDIGESEIRSVADVLRSGWITTGRVAEQFESGFARFLGSDIQAVAVNSGTAGLHLALESVGVGPGDEVVTTVYTFTATAEVVRYLGADPVFVDISADGFNLDTDAVAGAVTARTKAILPVHVGGVAADMPAVLAVGRASGLAVVEDAAHALPTTCGGRLVGALESDATVFSFYATKPLTTGEGGMLVTRSQGLADRVRLMRLHGIDRPAFDRYTSTKPQWWYQVVEPGFKYNLTDMAAALGMAQLSRLRELHARRTAIAQAYNEAFAELPVLLPPGPMDGDQHSWHLYMLRLREDAPLARDAFIERLFAMGIGCSVHFIPMFMHPYWRDRYKLRAEDYPNAKKAFESEVSLPIHTKMSDHDVERVISAVRHVLGGS